MLLTQRLLSGINGSCKSRVWTRTCLIHPPLFMRWCQLFTRIMNVNHLLPDCGLSPGSNLTWFLPVPGTCCRADTPAQLNGWLYLTAYTLRPACRFLSSSLKTLCDQAPSNPQLCELSFCLSPHPHPALCRPASPAAPHTLLYLHFPAQNCLSSYTFIFLAPFVKNQVNSHHL